MYAYTKYMYSVRRIIQIESVLRQHFSNARGAEIRSDVSIVSQSIQELET